MMQVRTKLQSAQELASTRPKARSHRGGEMGGFYFSGYQIPIGYKKLHQLSISHSKATLIGGKGSSPVGSTRHEEDTQVAGGCGLLIKAVPDLWWLGRNAREGEDKGRFWKE